MGAGGGGGSTQATLLQYYTIENIVFILLYIQKYLQSLIHPKSIKVANSMKTQPETPKPYTD